MEGGSTIEMLKSDAILAQLERERTENQVAAVDGETLSLLIVRIGAELFAVPGSEAKEIMPFGGSTWIPGANPALPGVKNVRGDVVAVIDAKQVLTIAESDGAESERFFVLLRSGDGRSGMIVDSVVDVIELPTAENMPPLSSLDAAWQRFAASQFDYHGKLVTVLQLDALLAAVQRV